MKILIGRIPGTGTDTGTGIGIGIEKTSLGSYLQLLTLGVNFVCFSVMSRQKKGKTDELTRRRSRVNNIYVDYPGSNQGFVSSNLKLENIGKPSPNVEMN